MQFELPHLVDALPGLGWTALPDGRAEFLNQRWLAYTGLTAEEAVGAGWVDAICPDDRDGVVRYWRTCVTAGAPCDTEVRLRRFDGAFRWFLFRANPLRDATGSLLRWFCVNIDVEDRKRTEEALRSNERNLNLILNTIPSLIHELGTDGSVRYVNQAVLDYAGFTLEDVRREDYRARLFHPEDLERVREQRLASLQRPVPFELEMRTRGADGSYRWFLNRYSPLLDKQGRLDRWYAATFDIEDRKRALDELKLRVDMIHLIPAAVWSVTPDGTPDLVNRGWCDYTGQTPEYVLSHPSAWMATMHPDDAEQAGKIYWDGIRSGTGFTMEARFLRASDGTYRWHLNRAVAVRDLAGNISRFVGTSTDIDDLKVAQEELHDTRATLAHVTRVMTMGELTASIAHEINQPLSGILTNAQTSLRMLGADPPNIAGALETARRTVRDANRAAEVVTRLRSMFKKKPGIVESVDLNEAAQDILVLLEHELRRNRIVALTDFELSLPEIQADRIQLQQVILNLVLNATDALIAVDDRPRQIAIGTGRDDKGDVCLTVRDNGAGIDAQAAGRLFDPFYTTKPSGMGIGLSLSRSIVEWHGGRLFLHESEGPGASFTIVIPKNQKRNI